MKSRHRGPIWGLAVFGLFVWFVFSASWITRNGVEGWVGAVLFYAWMTLAYVYFRRRRRRAR